MMTLISAASHAKLDVVLFYLTLYRPICIRQEGSKEKLITHSLHSKMTTEETDETDKYKMRKL